MPTLTQKNPCLTSCDFSQDYLTLALTDYVCSFTRIIYSSLNDVIYGEAVGRAALTEALVHVQSEELGHMVVVMCEVWILFLSWPRLGQPG